MEQARDAPSAREKARERRDRLRAQGLRRMEIWVPDVRGAGFRAEAHRQSLAVASSDEAAEDQAFVDTASCRDEE